jgi:hypothetical protein
MSAPRIGRPRAHASIEDAYRAHAVPTTDGHMEWTGIKNSTTGTPIVQLGTQRVSAYKVAFQLEHNREPVGYLKPSCGKPGCVAGAHLQDAPMRETARPPKRQFNPPPATRADIVALLAEGRSDRYIVKALHTSQPRVARFRAELGIPRPKRTALPLEEAWKARTQQTDDGHLAWTGGLREGVPVFKHDGEEYSARRLAFRLANGREPEGRVKTGCGWLPCVKPEHVEDQPMRDALRTQYTAIFGAIAA